MFRSLRWRLQVWHAVILFVVITGFGSVLFVRIRQARLDELDAELQAAARVLEGSLRGFPRPMLTGQVRLQPGSRPPPPPRRGDEPGPPPRNPPPPEHYYRTLELPFSLTQRYVEPEEAPYFIVWLGNGETLKATPRSEPVPSPARSWEELASPEQPLVRQRGSLREVILMGPERTEILVGRSIGKELAELERLAWQMALIGAGVFVFGLIGGWALSHRAVRPIDIMSTTANSIGASNLSQRIDLAGIDNELGRLGHILNSMLNRLEAAFEQQVRFAADASHELRTPLAVILSHTELALNRERSPEEYRQTLLTCRQAAERMKVLVESLLALARLDAGELQLQLNAIDLAEIVQETVEPVRPLAAERGLHLEVTTTPVHILGDAQRLAHVVSNLIMNAILYNRERGRITIVVTRDGDDAVVSVSDTGIGIAEEHLPRIFGRFFRVDKARSRRDEGSGLGLAICKCIVEAHGGSIRATSKLGEGSTFTVRLPTIKTMIGFGGPE